MSFLDSFLSPSGLQPYGSCLSWDPGLIWLCAGSDALILLSCLSILVSLVWLLLRRWHDRTYRWIAYLFVTFFVAYSMAYGLAIFTLWVPSYGLDGLVKAVAALVSLTAAAILWIKVPRLADMLSAVKTTSSNMELSHTVVKQEATLRQLHDIEQRLRVSNSKLEQKLAKHTADVRASNAQPHNHVVEGVAGEQLVVKSEAEYRASFDAATIGNLQMEPLSGRLLRINDAFAHLLGMETKELVGREIWDFVYADDKTAALAEYSRLLADEIEVCVVEPRLVRRDKVPVWVRLSATVVIDPAVGLPRLALGEVENIEVRHDAQADLRTTEALLHLALDAGPFGVWAFDIRNSLFWADERYLAMTGGEVEAETWRPLAGPDYAAWVQHVHPDDREKRDALLRTLFAGEGETVRIEYRASRADGGWSTVSQSCTIVERDPATGVPIRAAGVAADITERSAALADLQTAKTKLEQELQKRRAVLAHRHLLLREVYHRMNDTLRIVDRLFTSEAQQSTDREVLEALSDQRSRVYALGFVHGELMTSVDVETFSIAPFLQDLCDTVLANSVDRGVNLQLDAADLEVTLDHAIPFGMLATELLNNCLRHIPSRGDGRILVSLKQGMELELRLIVSDNDPEATDASRSASFVAGLETRLIRDLVFQLGAELRVCFERGLGVEIMMLHRAA